MLTLDSHPFSRKQISEALWGDFTSIRLDDDYLIFIDQSTNKVVGRVRSTEVELIENGDVWKGDI